MHGLEDPRSVAADVPVLDVAELVQRARQGIVAPLLLLLLAVVHAPRQAQALVSSFFPDIFPLATSEPVMRSSLDDEWRSIVEALLQT